MHKIALAAAALATALTAGAVPAQASTEAAQLVCVERHVCLYDAAGSNFLNLAEGCWFNNIGLQGHSDKTRAVVNLTRYPVNLANWNGRAWEHIGTVPAGHVGYVEDLGLGGVDAVHSICPPGRAA